MIKIGLPYMGSKTKVSSDILGVISRENSGLVYLFDLFGGGGGISFYGFQLGYRVLYNEIDRAVVLFLRDILEKGITGKYYQWVDRGEFNLHRGDKTWFGGFCSLIWAYGNNRDKGYLYSRKIEYDKGLLHRIIVDRDELAYLEFSMRYSGIVFRNNNSFFKSINERRLKILGDLRKLRDSRLRHLGNIQLEHLNKIVRLQYLERINRLERFGKIRGYNIHDNISDNIHDNINDNFIILNKSFIDVEIDTPVDKTVIYLDPPYANTAKYSKGIEISEVVDYMKGTKYKVYLSSYENPADFREVAKFKHRGLLNNNDPVTERLFCNREF